MSDSELLFIDDALDPPPVSTEEKSGKRWKILIIDDEQEVHKVTHLVLRNVTFDGCGLEFLYAFSAAQARDVLSIHPDIALALVDVVMETDHAGLDLVKWIRQTLKNEKVRLVLRTGQPGQAPEQQVIETYDINDYKDKTELTNIKLRTLLYAALRSYRDIITIDNARQGLERVIRSTATINESQSLRLFASAVLEQVNTLLHLEKESIYAMSTRALAATHTQGSQDFEVLAATGDLFAILNEDPHHRLPADILEGFETSQRERRSHQIENRFFGYYTSERGTEHMLYVSPGRTLTQLDMHLLELYSIHVGIAFENIRLRKEIENTQKELAYLLGEAVERRSKETGSHVKRVAKVSYRLAQCYGLPEVEAEAIKLASPLHDIGKVGIPDAVLNKPGPLSADEWEVMKTHAAMGYEILLRSDRPILQLGAVIAHEHHENWDGSGYPRGLKAEAIHIAGRITGLADVFDALGSHRCYKLPWGNEEIVAEIRRLSGTKFDPALVNLLLENLDEMLNFRKEFPD